MSAIDNSFSSGDAEASLTYPVKCSTLRRGGHVVIRGCPCRIVELSTAQPGKHGHSKVHIIGLDIFTGKKHEDICPSKENIEVSTMQLELNKASYSKSCLDQCTVYLKYSRLLP